MSNNSDTALRIAIWTLLAVCAAASVLFALHTQYMESGAFLLGVGQNVCNLILLKQTEK